MKKLEDQKPEKASELKNNIALILAAGGIIAAIVLFAIVIWIPITVIILLLIYWTLKVDIKNFLDDFNRKKPFNNWRCKRLRKLYLRRFIKGIDNV